MNTSLSDVLKAKRKEKNLKVKDVIQALQAYGVEIKEKTLYGWESGHRQPDADELLILCNIYGIESISELRRHSEESAKTPAERLDDVIDALTEEQAMFLVKMVEAVIARKGPEVYAKARDLNREIWEGDV